MKSDLISSVNSLEEKIARLLDKTKNLAQQNEGLQAEINEFKLVLEEKNKTLTGLENANKVLKNANAILGSDEHKNETKFKINSLVRQIDLCIAQLSK